MAKIEIPSEYIRTAEMKAAEQKAATIAAIKAEANRRIEAVYPIWRQLNIQAVGGDAHSDMRAFIDGIRAKSDAIEQMEPLPDNVSDDALWSIEE